jgi:hypothetical protein
VLGEGSMGVMTMLFNPLDLLTLDADGSVGVCPRPLNPITTSSILLLLSLYGCPSGNIPGSGFINILKPPLLSLLSSLLISALFEYERGGSFSIKVRWREASRMAEAICAGGTPRDLFL